MDEEPIPPLLPVDQMPAIHSQTDLHRHWRALMGPLGFSRRCLWLGLIDEERRPCPLALQIDELPDLPETAMLDNFMVFVGHLLGEQAGCCSVALLLSRPGPAAVTAADRTWAVGLAQAAGRAAIPLEPLHLATDEAVRVIAPDDLIERRTA